MLLTDVLGSSKALVALSIKERWVLKAVFDSNGHQRCRCDRSDVVPSCSQYMQLFFPLNCFMLVTMALAGRSREQSNSTALARTKPKGDLTSTPT